MIISETATSSCGRKLSLSLRLRLRLHLLHLLHLRSSHASASASASARACASTYVNAPLPPSQPSLSPSPQAYRDAPTFVSHVRTLENYTLSNTDPRLKFPPGGPPVRNRLGFSRSAIVHYLFYSELWDSFLYWRSHGVCFQVMDDRSTLSASSERIRWAFAGLLLA